MLNPIFSKKAQGQKHPERWGIVYLVSKCCLIQIPKVTSILVLDFYQTARHNWSTKENKKWHSAQEPRTPQKYNPVERDKVQLRQYWMTLLLYIYTSYNRSRIINAHTHTHICCGFDVSRNNTHTPSWGWIFNGHIKSPEKQNTKINITVRSQTTTISQLQYPLQYNLYSRYKISIIHPSRIHP